MNLTWLGAIPTTSGVSCVRSSSPFAEPMARLAGLDEQSVDTANRAM